MRDGFHAVVKDGGHFTRARHWIEHCHAESKACLDRIFTCRRRGGRHDPHDQVAGTTRLFASRRGRGIAAIPPVHDETSVVDDRRSSVDGGGALSRGSGARIVDSNHES
jgi:hypothetical protein